MSTVGSPFFSFLTWKSGGNYEVFTRYQAGFGAGISAGALLSGLILRVLPSWKDAVMALGLLAVSGGLAVTPWCQTGLHLAAAQAAVGFGLGTTILGQYKKIHSETLSNAFSVSIYCCTLKRQTEREKPSPPRPPSSMPDT